MDLTASGRRRMLALCAGCVAIGVVMAGGARAILWLIAGITNLAFYGRLSAAAVRPAGHHLGPWVILVPAAGGLIVGLMARFGSRSIQGHGIPEAMEQVLLNGSRIPARVLALKPLSTSVVIGTGGPFGAEGVVIATGGALGSLGGQWLSTTPIERKTLLAAGAAAGLSATFACPISAVLLAVELLLFEFHPRSLIPVALASAAAAAARVPLLGEGPIFSVGAARRAATPISFLGYLVLGAVAGVVAVALVGLVHRVEHGFERLPIHWIWKPALGGLLVGAIGWFEPRVFGPGYADIEALLGGAIPAAGALKLGALKLAAWTIGVGSATSSGTLAPLLLIGSSIGALVSHLFGTLLDPRVAALCGMAAFFGGMSGAFLASVVMAFESTYQPGVLMPLLASGSAAYLVSRMLSHENIMTQKFIRQGVAVPVGLTANPLDWLHVGEAAAETSVVVDAEQTVKDLLDELGGLDVPGGLLLPAADEEGRFLGWIKAGALEKESNPNRPAADLLEETGAVVAEDATLREAVRRMVQQGVDRLAVLSCTKPDVLVGVITQREILAAYRHEEEGLDAPRLPKLRFLGTRKHA